MKLAAVDDTLEKLGTPKMYEKLHMKSKLMIIGWVVYSLAMNFFDTAWWINFKETASCGLYIAHIINYCIHVNTFMDMLFIFFLWFVYTYKNIRTSARDAHTYIYIFVFMI